MPWFLQLVQALEGVALSTENQARQVVLMFGETLPLLVAGKEGM